MLTDEAMVNDADPAPGNDETPISVKAKRLLYWGLLFFFFVFTKKVDGTYY